MESRLRDVFREGYFNPKRTYGVISTAPCLMHAQFAKTQAHAEYGHMPNAHELRAGDVVVLGPGDVRQVLHALPTSVDQYALVHITFTSGPELLCGAERAFARIHPPDAPIAAPRPVQPHEQGNADA